MHLPGFDSRGDYRYGTGVGFHHLSGGLWGLLRVYDAPSAAQAINPTPLGNVDNPHAGGHPIMPLEIQNVATNLALEADPAVVQPGEATTLSGRLAATGGPLERRPVTIESRPTGSNAEFAPVPDGRLTTDAEGRFSLPNVAPERDTDYRAVFAGSPGSGLDPSRSAVRPVVVSSETDLQAKGSAVTFGQPASVTGTLQKGATPLAGKRLTIEERPVGETGFAPVGAPVTTDANGRYAFTGLRPQKHTDYRVAFEGEPASGLRPSEATVRVDVRAAVNLSVAKSDLKLKKSRPISGSVAPAHAGDVELVVKRNGTPVLTETLPLNAESGFSYRYKPAKTGKYAVQVSFAGDEDHLANKSPVRSFKVVR